jgi:CheY-like chemotaxis protein
VNKPESTTKKIVLAEDDEDDFLLFQEALNEYEQPLRLNWVKDGEELMKVLKPENAEIPDIVFLDINMTRKNGFECLTEMRQHQILKYLPVIIFSTSNDQALISWMYNAGANLYLNKPTDFRKLKESIYKAISLDWKVQTPYPPVKDFVLS